MKRWAAGLVAIAPLWLAGAEARAGEISEEAWRALHRRIVLIEQHDGSFVRGLLGSVDGPSVGLVREDGRPAVIEKARVRRVRAVDGARVPGREARASAPPIFAPPTFAPPPTSGPIFGGSDRLVLHPPTFAWSPALSRVDEAMALTPPHQLFDRLSALPEAFALAPHERLALLARYQEPPTRRAGALLLNTLLLPGLGSALQGDTGYGYATMGLFFTGLGMVAGDARCAFRCTAPKIGGGLMFGAWLIGLARPFLYESPRLRALKRFFARTVHVGRHRVDLAPALSVAPGLVPDHPSPSPRGDEAIVTAGIGGRF